MNLAGKRIFITGGSRGIGLAIALRAARDGASVAIAAKTVEVNPKLPGTIYTAADEIRAAGGNAFRHFQSLSNELVLSKVLLCPADKQRTAAAWQSLTNDNISYFVGLDAVPGKPGYLLSGDRNLTNQTAAGGGILYLSTNAMAGWSAELHNFKGNALFADGRVEQLDDRRLQEALRIHGSTPP